MKKRIIYLDYLRVAAIMSVVILHVAAQNWYNLDGQSLEWNIFNFYDSIVRWGVPIFVMISGSLFLSKKIETKSIYIKNVLKLVIVYFVWSIFYGIFVPIDKFIMIIEGKISYKLIITNIIEGCYHMWFIPMIIGIYMCIPIIKQIIKSKSIMKYFMRLSLVFSFIVPQIVWFFNDFIGGFFTEIINKINSIISNMNMHLVLGFTFYFILGYILNNINLEKYQRNIIYILGTIGFSSTVLLNAIIAWKTNQPCPTYYDNFSINVLLESIAIHTFFKYKIFNSKKLNAVISKLSKYSFGAYLSHIFVIEALQSLGLNTLLFSPIISVPIISIITIIISYIISFILNKIPKINKWIV